MKKPVAIFAVMCLASSIVSCSKFDKPPVETPTTLTNAPSSQPNDDIPPETSDATLHQQPSTTKLTMPDSVELADLWERIDGSTATIPLTATLYDAIQGGDSPPVHNATSGAYYSLIHNTADLIFVTYPSEDEFIDASENGVELEIIPVVKDALVFLVNVENPVMEISLSKLRNVYTGQITNWEELGGYRAEIIPYQRNIGSGSQTLFLKLLMDGVPPMHPPTEWRPATMDALVELVSNYDNSKEAIGYSMFYYVNNMYGNSRFKLLGIDGVDPSRETITRGEYPLEDYYYAVLRKDTPPNAPARTLINWLLSDSGQEVAIEAGYIPLRQIEGAQPDSEVDPIYIGNTETSSGTGGTLLKESIDDAKVNGVRRKLSDMFFDGFNYIQYINTAIMEEINRIDNELFRDTMGDQYLIRPFSGIPNNYPNYELLDIGTLRVDFPNGNPFFKEIRTARNSREFYIKLTEDISPYGVGLPDLTVTYEYIGRLLPDADLYTLRLSFPENPEVSAIINNRLESWVESFNSDSDALKRLSDFCVWYLGNISDGRAYQFQPTWSRWKDYLSVSYILQTYDGPSSNLPMIFTICFDINTGATVNLRDNLPSNVDYSKAWGYTIAEFDGLGQNEYYPQQEFIEEGSAFISGSVITDAWIMYGNIFLYVTEPTGRTIQVALLELPE